TGNTDRDKSHVDIGFYTSTCGDGATDTAFGREQCDPPGVCCTSTCQFSSTSTVCRPGAGVCDVAENCTGSSAACPGDGFASTSTTCRPSAGVCDVAENCTGSGAACPGDGFASTSTTCRPSAGV